MPNAFADSSTVTSATAEPPEAARDWATNVDGANALVINASRSRADLVISGETARIL